MKKISGIIFLTFILLFLASCSSAKKSESYYEPKEAVRENNTVDKARSEEEFSDELNDDNFENSNSIEANRKIIKTGHISIESIDYTESISRLKNLISLHNGYIFSSEQYNGSENDLYYNKNSYYTIKIPSEKFDNFMNDSSTVGDVINKTEQKEDITSVYMDVEARLNTLKVQEERLLSILEKSENLESIIEIEKELSDTRYEIEKIEATIRTYDDSIAYSTINVQLTEIKLQKDYKEKPISLIEKIKYAFVNSFYDTGRFLESFLLLLIRFMPFIIFILILIFGIRGIIKKNKKNILKKQEIKSEKEDDKKYE